MEDAMRGDSDKKLIFFLFGILIALILGGPILCVKAETKSESKTTLIIGDSIPYGMSLA